MNALPTPSRLPQAVVRPAAINPSVPVRHVHRERDFGIGYGNSSGYGNLERRYADVGIGLGYFRCR
jgi:hypothetical protein